MSSKDGQHSPSSGAGSKSTPTQWYTNEIQQMMFGLGDCRRPLHESAAMVEEIVQQQMAMLLHKATEVANLRCGRFIGMEDILFLMRKDKVKLKRLLRYLELKDIKSAALKSASTEDEDVSETGETKQPQPMKRRKKICLDFLSSIDQTGELADLLEDDTEDDVKHERLLRAELSSRNLDPQQYLEFCEARQVNFSRRYKSQRFKDWLLSGATLELKPNIHAMELISYLAYETVAQVVDLALLVKKDMRADIANPLTHNMPSVSHTYNESVTMTTIMGQAKSSFPGLTSPTVSPPATPVTQSSSSTLGQGAQNSTPVSGAQSSSSTPGSTNSSSTNKAKNKKRKRNGVAVTMETPVSQAIQPSDIREAIRRYTGLYGPFASQTKVNKLYSPRTRLLCC